MVVRHHGRDRAQPRDDALLVLVGTARDGVEAGDLGAGLLLALARRHVTGGAEALCQLSAFCDLVIPVRGQSRERKHGDDDISLIANLHGLNFAAFSQT
jgi:hypothetical protein